MRPVQTMNLLHLSYTNCLASTLPKPIHVLLSGLSYLSKKIKFIRMKTTYTLLLALLLFICTPYSQAQQPNSKPMTSEQVLEMSYEQLLNLPFEDLINLANIVGVSTDQLLEMILNKELTTASKRRETAFDSPLSSSVVTADEIERAGVTTIEEALRLVPGMIVREKTNGVYDVHVRGFDNVPADNFEHFAENTISLVMIDGSPVYNNVSGGTFWETLPVTLSQIERIEVVRGAASALYGPNAASGVVNIITKTSANKKLSVNLTARTGTFNTNVGDLSVTSKLTNKLKVSASGSYDFRNRYDDKYYSFAQGTYNEMGNGMPNIVGSSYIGHQYQSLDFDRSKEVMKGNLSAIYEIGHDMQVRATGGYQDSKIQTAFFENLATPFSVRSSQTGFGNLQANIKGLSANVFYQQGHQNLCEGMTSPVIEYDMSNLFANAEYNIELGHNLSIRPGINYQKANYDDSKYVKQAQTERGNPAIAGLFGKNSGTELLAGSLRADYTAWEKLRLVAAVRADKYTDIDKTYPSYQFAATYKLTSNHLVRGVYSKAYRGAFVGDLHSNFRNTFSFPGQYTPEQMQPVKDFLNASPMTAPLVGLLRTDVPYTVNYNQYYIGSKVSDYNLKLMGMNLVEVGYRGVFSDMLQVDVEGFYSKAQDFDVLVDVKPVDDNLPTAPYYTLDDLLIEGAPAVDNTTPVMPQNITIHDSLLYQNIPLTASQYGVTGTVNLSLTKQLQVKAFATWQQTQLEKHITVENDTVSRTHNNTPAVYGGLSVTYLPTSYLDVYLGGYYYTAQTYNRYYRLTGNPDTDAMLKANAQDKIPGKFILNLRVAYHFYKNNKVFIETKNLLFDNSREFGFTDPVKMMVMGGISLGF